MNNVIIKSLVISAVIGAVSTISINTITATFIAGEAINGTQSVLTGLEAVKASINEFGLVSYIQGLIGYFVFFFFSVFIGCLWLNKWSNKGSENNAT